MLGLLVFLCSAGLAFARSAWLPAALICGLAWDRLLPLFGWRIYSNEWLLAGACLGLALGRARRPLPRPAPAWLAWAAAPLALVLGAHALWPGPAAASLKALLRFAEFWLGLALPALCLPGRESLRRALQWWAAALALFSIWGLVQAWAGPGAFLNAAHPNEVYGRFQAASSFFEHHNQFSAYLASSLPMLAAALALGLLSPPLGLASLALGLAALAATYSRGAWAGLAFGTLAASFLLPPRARLIARLALPLVLALVLLQGGLRDRIDSALSPDHNQDRALIARQGLAIWKGNYAWGCGAGTVDRELPARVAALSLEPRLQKDFSSHLHNQWLQGAVEFGGTALLGWLAFLAAMAWRAWRRGGAAGAAWVAGLTAFALQGCTDLLLLHDRGLGISLAWGLCLAMLP